MQAAPDAMDSQGDGSDRIAIVGMAGRFPGSADLRQLWRNLCDGIEGITSFTEEELRAAGVPDAELATPNYVRAAPILEDVELFDAGFFRMSRPEAEITDPQHRLFMECVWEALEDAGCVPARVRGAVGIYAGSSLSGYLYFNLRHTYTLSEQGFQSLIGNDKDYLASHTAYKLDLGGPAVGVQSACSTSLVAVHLACQSLLSHECDLAIAGGATVRARQQGGYVHQEGGIFSPDGHCRPFDEQAGGTVFGSGVGTVVLRRLDDALAAGDRIYAVILGSAINNDGARKVGYTAPGEDGQVRVVSEALEVAGVDPSEIGFIETHGTGTRLGDPIEISALKRVFRGVAPGDCCALGAVKSNVGHLESAAGIVGLIKAALALHHRAIPPTLHFESPNPMIDFASSPFYVNTELRPWPDLGGPNRAGVSSFGIGGTNAHLVLEEAPEAAEAPPAEPGAPQLLPVSARSSEALRELAARYRDRLRAAGGAAEIWQVAAGAALRRAHHDHRLALVFNPAEGDPAAVLDAFVAGGEVHEAGARLVHGQFAAERRPKVVFVFPGQGSQWLGMGRQLLAGEPVFRRSLEACDAAIRRQAGWSLLEVLAADEESSRLGELDVVQPALFAMQVALAALWRSWGVEPDALIGHSMGEVAAACVSGALSLEDAARVICDRSRLALKVRGRGAMAVVELSADAAHAALTAPSDCSDRVSVAARNSPRSTVLSGDAEALGEVIGRLERRGVYCRWVKVDFASHSPQVDPLLGELEEILAGLQPRAGEVPIYSTVEGQLTDGAGLDAGYWVRNLRQPVLLADMIDQARRDGHDLFIEVSPHPILVPSVADCLVSTSGNAVALASLRREENEREAMLGTVAAFYARGGEVDWAALYPQGAGHVELPAYPWQRERYWIDAVAEAPGPRPRAAGEHPLLAEPLHSSLHPGTRYWQCQRPGDLPVSLLQGEPVLPAALLLELALSAQAKAAPCLENVVLEAGGAWPASETLQLVLSPAGPEQTGFRISCATAGEGAGAWTVLAAGRSGLAAEPVDDRIDVPGILDRCVETLTAEAFYRERREAGLENAESCRLLGEIRRRDGEALVRLQSPSGGDGFQIHPALLDACFQALVAAAPLSGAGPIPYLPAGAEAIRLQARPGEELWLHAALRPAPQGSGSVPSAVVLEGDVTLCDGEGRPLLRGQGLRARWPIEHWLYEARWESAGAVEPPAPGTAPGTTGPWLLFQDRGGVGETLALALAEHAETFTQVFAGAAYAASETGVVTLNPSRVEDFRQLLDEVAAGGPPPRGIVYLWGLDAGEVGERATVLVCDGLTHLVQALAEREGGNPPRLNVVSRAVHQVLESGEDAGLPEVAQAPLWGLSAVIGQEHPELRCRTIDLGPGMPAEETLAALLREVQSGDREDRVALRGEGRSVARLVHRGLPAPSQAAGTERIRPDGTYLITGGLSGLGLACARFLVERGARHLALLARSAPSAEAAEALRRLSEAGAEIRTFRADVAEERQLAAALDEIAAGMPPLRGVVHAAGVRDAGPVDESLLRRQTPERFRRVLAPKVSGSWNLHRLTLGRELDFFLLFSSVATLFGSLGQSSYAAANSFLDALTLYRKAAGLSCLTINWGAWAEIGMASAAPDLDGRLAYEGMASIAPADGLEVLHRLMSENGPASAARVVVMPFRHALWQRFNPQASAAPLFAHLAAAEAGAGGAAAGQALRDRILSAPVPDRLAILERYLAERVSEALRVASDRIDPEAPLNQLGLSSLLSLEVRNRMERDLGLAIPIVQFLQSESIRQFATQLVERLVVEQLLASVTGETEATETEEWDHLTL